MKTAELSGTALDWAVAKCECVDEDECLYVVKKDGWKPSTDWSQGGPIIEREKIALYLNGDDEWSAEDGWKRALGETPLIAAMRCYVAIKLGDEVDIPSELLEVA